MRQEPAKGLLHVVVRLAALLSSHQLPCTTSLLHAAGPRAEVGARLAGDAKKPGGSDDPAAGTVLHPAGALLKALMLGDISCHPQHMQLPCPVVPACMQQQV